jgi:HK97 family phage portal protein
MRSFAGTLIPTRDTLRNASPVPLTARRGASGGIGGTLFGQTSGGTGAQLDAMGSSGRLYAIVTRLALGTAGLTWHLYEKAKPGQKPEERVEVTRHPALNVWDQWNPFYSRTEGVEVGQQHVDLAGESFLVIGRNPRATVPLELWPVRPDRMTPVKHPTDFLAGWVYTSPDGEQVPLRVDEVIQVKSPNPSDPYRGLSPVQTIMTDVQSLQYAREWNRNFFLNSAEPGGIIEVDRNLDDTEFDQMTQRWREQHQGVARAHRVAILEQGTWKDRKMTQRDMEFTSLNGLSTEAIRDAYGFPKPSLGAVDDVNRANADAADVLLARHLIVPRGNRWKGALNNRFLPLFGAASAGLEFDFDSPVPEDVDQENTTRASVVTAYVQLTRDARVTPKSAAEFLGMPELEHEEPEPVPAALQPGQPGQVPPPPGEEAPEEGAPKDALGRLRATVVPHVHNAAAPEDDPSSAALDAAVAAVLLAWADPLGRVKDAIAEAVRAVVEAGSRLGLTSLGVDVTELGDILARHLSTHAATTAGQVVSKAAADGVALDAGIPDTDTLTDMAHTVAAIYGRDLETSAARDAMRAWGPLSSPDDVAAVVGRSLTELTDAGPRAAVEPALVQAEGHGLLATIRANGSTVGSLYAKERRDRASCLPCSEIDGRFLGTTDDLAQVFATHPNGSQYIGCLGRSRCRGEIEGVWRK